MSFLQVFVERALFSVSFSLVCRSKLNEVLPSKIQRALLLSLLAQDCHSY